MSAPPTDAAGTSARGSVLEVLGVATRLGLTSFGGPVAHLGYFRDEYVARRRWLDERTFADLVALCQLLPGPASSELGIAIGILRAGLGGGLAAWLGFTMPSAIALTAFAFAVRALGAGGDLGWLHGLQVVAVVVIAQAVWTMGRSLTPDRPRLLIAVGAAILTLLVPSGLGQIAVIVIGGALGAWLLRGVASKRGQKGGQDGDGEGVAVPIGRRLGAGVLVAFVALLVALPLARHLVDSRPLAVAESFFVVASFVFGGGHVMLPLLQAQVVPAGWVTSQQFLAGYGAAQAVPGPLFTFSAYLGAVMGGQPSGVPGAALALAAMFAPSFFLVIGALPFWDVLRRHRRFQAVLAGVNAAVVGLLLGALYDPVWVSTVHGPSDLVLVLAAFALLFVGRMPPWVVVLVTGVLGAAWYGLAHGLG